ncbi:SDR family NAD(P)-dependent oxidoreductase [Parapedobacter sp. GCM10030251]|uniref:SDR family NAD(P)-dependent oxidoreductase n=1 Tax=Parapedobacter sp. GCM10030251 TaxID=3273419 RepID=UPI003623A678
MSVDQRFEGKAVLISGGLGDIAQAIALAFGKAGARIALSDFAPLDEAENHLAALRKQQVEVHYTVVDVRDSNAVSRWVADVAGLWGEISIAVANAATVTMKPFRELSAAEWSREMEVNLNGSFFLANAACRHFVDHQVQGNIIFLGSWAAHAVHAALPAYGVSKAAVRMLCQSMALEYAPYGVRVNEVAPGYVNAGLSRLVWQEDPAQAEEARLRVPVKALIEPEEVARQVLWVCDPGNKHFTGSTLLMDGGLSLKR